MFKLEDLKTLKPSSKGASKSEKYNELLNSNEAVKDFIDTIKSGVSYKSIVELLKEKNNKVYTTQSLKSNLKDKVLSEDFKAFVNNEELYNEYLEIVNKTRVVK